MIPISLRQWWTIHLPCRPKEQPALLPACRSQTASIIGGYRLRIVMGRLPPLLQPIPAVSLFGSIPRQQQLCRPIAVAALLALALAQVRIMAAAGEALL